MSENDNPQCPFVYATGKRCCGTVSGVRFYGNIQDGYPGVKKVRIWCSAMHDHAGADRGFAAKDRMEFYPDQIPTDLKQYVWGRLEAERATAQAQ